MIVRIRTIATDNKQDKPAFILSGTKSDNITVTEEEAKKDAEALMYLLIANLPQRTMDHFIGTMMQIRTARPHERTEILTKIRASALRREVK
jgi:hypothetical protein